MFLANLYSEERGQGHAKELMEKVCATADIQGMTLVLNARAYGPRPYGLENGALVLFYESFGFVSVPGPTKNLMERKPSQEKQPL